MAGQQWELAGSMGGRWLDGRRAGAGSRECRVCGGLGAHPHFRRRAQRCADERLHPARRGIGHSQRHEGARSVQLFASRKHNEVVLRWASKARRRRGMKKKNTHTVALPACVACPLASTKLSHLVLDVRLFVAGEFPGPESCGRPVNGGKGEGGRGSSEQYTTGTNTRPMHPPRPERMA